MQAELDISSFLDSLRSAGIAVPWGICILDSDDRLSSEAAASQARLAGRSQGGGGSLESHASAATVSSVPSWFDDS